MLHIRDKQAGEKHVFCLQADQDNAFVMMKIGDARRLFAVASYGLMHPGPMPGTEHVVPPHDPRPKIEERFAALSRTVSRVSCYVKIRGGSGSALCNLPTAGEDGGEWLKGFLRSYRGTCAEFRRLRDDAAFFAMLFVTFVGLDVIRNKAFSLLYMRTLTAAAELIHTELHDTDTPHIAAFWRANLAHQVQTYVRMAPLERLVPDAASLSEYALIVRVSHLARIVLQRWDRLHALDVPLAHRILEVFAFEAVDLYDRGVYDLRPRFTAAPPSD